MLTFTFCNRHIKRMNRYQNDNKHKALQTVKVKIGAFNFTTFFSGALLPSPSKSKFQNRNYDIAIT